MGGHWHNKYIGLPYSLNVYDCAHLCEEVLLNEFGKEIHLPQHDHLKNVAEACAEIDKYKEQTGFKQVEEPEDGDVVLMRRGGLLHIGVYFTLGTTPFVLHNLAATGVIAEKIRTLKVLGFYRWNVAIQPIR